MRRCLLALYIASITACARVPTPAPAVITDATPQPTALHWTRTAAEHRALFLQVYSAASDQLRQVVRDRPAGSWAVIMDADETVLDNSEYQRRNALRGARYEVATWNAWVREIAADTLPGAPAFIRLVRELGGHVVIVTSREEVVCAATRENFRRLLLTVAAVLCQQPGERGKSARFRAVTEGTTGTTLPRLAVVMFIGDNIQDFPDATQELRNSPSTAFERFGRSWFVLPNPMYGSWERNPAR